MKTLSGREFARLLESRGWQLARVSGSHHVYVKPGQQARISVPVHANRSLKLGIQSHFMKLAGLTEADLE